jgi:hypothetical protein
MVEPADRVKPIPVKQLMLDILSALGEGSAQLISSQSPHASLGTLAVKTADVTITFDMSSEASEKDNSLTVLPPSVTGLGVSVGQADAKSSAASHAVITLNIVNVLDVLPTPPKPPDDWKARLQPALTDLISRVEKLHIPADIKQSFIQQLNSVLAADTMEQAQQILIRSLKDFHERTQDVSLPADIRSILDALAKAFGIQS